MSSQMEQHSLALHVVVVGCGISGLSIAYALGRTGHRITVVELAPLLTDVGAGIQITPNVSRILMRWGLGPHLHRSGVQPTNIAFRRYEDDNLIGMNALGDRLEREFGAPYWNVHRADLLQMLYNAAKPYLNVIQDRVISVSTLPNGSPSVSTETGLVIQADLVIGADGIKSIIRPFITAQKDRPKPTGELAYRVVIPTDTLLHDPLLRPLVEDPGVTIWMGPNHHVVGYCVSAKKLYNLVLIRPDADSEESWSTEAEPEEIRATYEHWSPRVTKLVSLIRQGTKSRLVVRDALRTWVHANGRVALIGDACHSMLPSVAQGAAMAVEDAAVLGALLSSITSHSQIPDLLRAYQSLRMSRTKDAQLAAQSNWGVFHLPDGPEQRARDKAMQELMQAESQLGSQEERDGEEETGDRLKARILYSYDPYQAVDEWYRAGGYKIYQQRTKL